MLSGSIPHRSQEVSGAARHLSLFPAVQISALEFSRDRKMMSVLARQGPSLTLFCKGAPEAVLPRCTQVPPPCCPPAVRTFMHT